MAFTLSLWPLRMARGAVAAAELRSKILNRLSQPPIAKILPSGRKRHCATPGFPAASLLFPDTSHVVNRVRNRACKLPSSRRASLDQVQSYLSQIAEAQTRPPSFLPYQQSQQRLLQAKMIEPYRAIRLDPWTMKDCMAHAVRLRQSTQIFSSWQGHERKVFHSPSHKLPWFLHWILPWPDSSTCHVCGFDHAKSDASVLMTPFAPWNSATGR